MNHYETLTYVKKDSLVIITLNRPNEANGINSLMSSELAKASKVCDGDPMVKAVILTGNGRFFCAGGDVKTMAGLGEKTAAGIKNLADELHTAISTFSRMRAPVIVAVNGTAAGAGFSLAITGDMVIAAESASFTTAYTKIGLSPDGSSSYYLPRLVGIRKAQELMYTNRSLSADEALEWGIINKVVADQDLLPQAEKLAEHFVNGSADSNFAIKKLLLQTFGNGLETQMEIEGRYIAACAGSKNGLEGIKAFNEKRKPNFE